MSKRMHVGYAILRILMIVPRATVAKLSEDIDVPIYTVRFHVRQLRDAGLIDPADFVYSGVRRKPVPTYRLHPHFRAPLP